MGGTQGLPQLQVETLALGPLHLRGPGVLQHLLHRAKRV
eukprot:CAMPEP_0175370054 /NCGR_PEP_ID=MMETSP0095-20121207/21012_1 /TAXON_ID=311494 /ORGANISM="Alexandrium monilatum, Strain CCMP3105" /LENGTH=38 /DNA_ID= /DNA_START= /DNA_END= /DNA_ORIENTATION=